VTRPRAADDFDTIYERIKELRRQTAAAPQVEAAQPTRAEAPLTDKERRLKDRREGLPPPWVPTIFINKLTKSEPAASGMPAPVGPLRLVRSGWSAPVGPLRLVRPGW
jgi:hypothetical protein